MTSATPSPISSVSPVSGPRPFFALGAVWLCALACLLLPPSEARAQEIRSFPVTALRGRLVVVTPPQVQLDGKADQFSPGVRIRNTLNLLVMPATLAGQELRVNYTREASTGLLQEVWILTDAEAALRRPGSDRPWYNFIFGGSEDVAPK